VPERRLPGRLRKAGPPPPSRAALGVVKVGPDFADEYPDGDPKRAEVFATLVRTGEAAMGELERAVMATFGVQQGILNSLAVIEGAATPLTPSQVSERTFISSATMTSTLDTLEYLGWIRRVPNPTDRRSVLLEITDDGQATADRFLPGVRALENAALAELTTTELTTLLRLLNKALTGIAATAAAEPIPLEGRRNRPARHP